jgi:hypothetical protein
MKRRAVFVVARGAGIPRSSLAMAATETTIAKDCAILGYRDVLVSQDENDASVHALVYADIG